MILNDGTILYHGSYTQVSEPDLSKCKFGKDFGRGFYLTTSKSQAERFAKTSNKKAKDRRLIEPDCNKGFVSSFVFNEQQSLNIYEFKTADAQWLHCVVGHRRSRDFKGEIDKWSEYDIICGKIANDNTNLVITAYIDGIYGNIMSDTADRIAIGFLEPDNLKDQICIRTAKALRCLSFIECQEVTI